MGGKFVQCECDGVVCRFIYCVDLVRDEGLKGERGCGLRPAASIVLVRGKPCQFSNVGNLRLIHVAHRICEMSSSSDNRVVGDSDSFAFTSITNAHSVLL